MLLQSEVREKILETNRIVIYAATASEAAEFEVLQCTDSDTSSEEIVACRKRLTDNFRGFRALFCALSPFKQYSIFLKESGEYIGNFSLVKPEEEELSDTEQHAQPVGFSEFTIYLIPKYVGKGIGTEITTAILTNMVKPLLGTFPLVWSGVDQAGKDILKPMQIKFQGVTCEIYSPNFASLASHLKSGFIPSKHVVFKFPGPPEVEDSGFVFQYPTQKNNFTDQLTAIIQQWIAYGKKNTGCLIEEDKLTPEAREDYRKMVQTPYENLEKSLQQADQKHQADKPAQLSSQSENQASKSRTGEERKIEADNSRSLLLSGGPAGSDKPVMTRINMDRAAEEPSSVFSKSGMRLDKKE